jgi:PAS domain S-box-containing protein
MEKPLRVLMVEDSEDDVLLVVRALKKGGYDPVFAQVEDAGAMLKALQEKTWDVILCDYQMPQFNGLAAIALLKETGIDIPLIIVSGAIGEETAVECMHLGAHDYVMKGNLSRLVPAIERELKEAKSRIQGKQAEDALRENEDRFRRVSSMISDVAYSCSMKENGLFSIDWMEGAAERISGYSIEEIKARQCWRFLVIEEDLALFDTNVTGLSPGSHASCELRIQRKSGAIAWVESYAECVRMEMPESFILYSALVDITERKQAEQAFRDSESKYRLLAENVSDVIYTLDMDLRYTYISPSVKLLQGFEPAELLNQSANDTITHSSVELVMKALSEVMELEKSGHGEIIVSRTLAVETIRKDGTTIWTEEKFSLLKDEKKQPIGILGISRDISERKQSEEKLQQTLENLRKAFIASIQLLVSAVEARDPYTAGHQIRSANLARAIATEMGLPRDKIEGLRMAGSIHDIGKLSIPAEILSKPTKLTNIEFSLIKEHSVNGYEMLKGVESPWPLAEIVYQHHERMDGSGYPRNLKGDEILMEARILSVADVVESMASHRPYRPAIGIEAALEEIGKNKGVLYDDAVADACLRLFREKGFKL